ncbi:MAG: DM13 domain-containing protein [Rhizobiales bacterium]|nr:DM13 domain-containing protein [Hyphomicrobiales bacterium]NRB13296.1 DM13 domain-containing protein [Hyphomicrobiales bacterium]
MKFFKIILFAVAMNGFSMLSPAAFESKTGEFTDADPGHQGSGLATLAKQNGKFVLTFEDFYVTPGPDLYVMLVKNPTPKTSQAVLESDSLELAILKSPSGGQTYQLNLAMDIDPSEFGSVVIWCKQYSVLFAYAELN